MAKTKFYGVRVGREGPSVYGSWTDCALNTNGFPGSLYKGFASLQEAEQWIRNFTTSSGIQETSLPVPSSSGVPTYPQEPLSSTRSSADSELLKILSPNLNLSSEQRNILDRVNNGDSLFFTGSAGTGKSVLLREIIKSFARRHVKTAVTASTGIAAVNIGGSTLHSWAGIGLGKEHVSVLIDKILDSKGTRKRWTSTKALIIDEISMIDGGLLDKLDLIGQAVRGNGAPFGGIQIISGDFLQLPPVPDHLDGIQLPVTFAFESKVWLKALGAPAVLSQVFRQKDQEFVQLLNQMRYGQIETSIAQQITALSRTVLYRDGIDPTELYPRKAQVERANEGRLDRIQRPLNVFQSDDVPGNDSYGRPLSAAHADKLLERLVATSTLKLKVGAQVMLIKNLVQGHLVNGSVGRVVAFENPRDANQHGHEIATVDETKEAASVALALHRSTGDGGQRGLPDRKKLDREWPLVQFPSGQKLLMVPEKFEVISVRGDIEATRLQVPLILAWALSVHKSQGQTLQRVKVDLTSTFENGQAYVALSRATQMEALQVTGFHPSRVKAHPKVIEWERQARSTNNA